jgi:DNA primase
LIAARPGNAKSGGAGPLRDGVDPDSLVAGGGALLLREAVDRAQSGIEFFVNEVWGRARNNPDARTRAFEDAVRLVAKVANPMKRDLFIGILAGGLGVEPAAVRSALTRASGQGGGGPPRQQPPYPNPSGHPNAPDPDGSKPAAAGPTTQSMPSAEEVEVISLLADHPSLIATAEADKAFWLLTDARLQAMYSAARAGQSLLDLAATSGQLPPPTIVHVLSGKYADSKDPREARSG